MLLVVTSEASHELAPLPPLFWQQLQRELEETKSCRTGGNLHVRPYVRTSIRPSVRLFVLCPGASCWGLRACQRRLRACQRGLGACQRGLGVSQRGLRACKRGLRAYPRGLRVCQRGLGPSQGGPRACQRGLRACQKGLRACPRVLRASC